MTRVAARVSPELQLLAIRQHLALMILLAVAGLLCSPNPTLAHSFKVVLIVPLSGAESIRGRQIREGFMLATAERDSHPEQVSDGHLGGLDVYLTTIDGQGHVGAEIERLARQGMVDIVAAFGPETMLSRIGKQLDERAAVLLRPGETPFSDAALPAVRAFIAASERAYGARPSSHAAEGYNAARRIDGAVRSQGGVDDRASLRRHFRLTEHGFNW